MQALARVKSRDLEHAKQKKIRYWTKEIYIFSVKNEKSQSWQ